MMSHKTLLPHVTAINYVIRHDVFVCSLLHCELRNNMCVYIHVEIKLMVFHMFFIIRLLQQVSALLTSACEQISLQVPVN